AGVGRHFASDQVSRDNSFRMPIDDYQVEHLRARKHLHGPKSDLAAKRLVGAEQELLAGLPAGIKGSRNLRPAKRTISEEPAIFASEGHALGDTLINDIHAHLRQPVNIRLARPEITTFDRIVKKPVDTVAVILIIFGSIDAALG